MSDQRGAGEAPASLERRGRVAVLTLNRPGVLNAVNQELATLTGDYLEEAATDPGIGAIVVTGAGRAFCAGADLKEIAAGRDVVSASHPEWGFAGFVRHFVPKPVIAAVNGFAFGGGVEILLASDLGVIESGGRLGLPEASRGLFPSAGGVIRLQRQIPRKRALEMVLTGDPLTAEEAERWGLVNRIAPPGSTLETAIELAERIVRNAPLGLEVAKRMLHRSEFLGSDWDAPVWLENEREQAAIWASEDAAEGTAAFIEKREPIWRGR